MIVKIKLNQNLSTPKGKLVKDQVINIDCTALGTPTDRFWRNRFKDSKIDNCLSIIDQASDQAKNEKPINKTNKSK